MAQHNAYFALSLVLALTCRVSHAFDTNATGSSFASPVYQVTTFAYDFITAADTVTYMSTGSGTGKCNIQGFWNTGNIGSYPSGAVKTADTAACALAVRDTTRTPLVDWAASDSLFGSADYSNFPDLAMYPAMAGAVVPVYNIPELAGLNQTLTFSRTTIAYIYAGYIQYWNDTLIKADNPGLIASLLPYQRIQMTVRQDTSGTSEIFANGLVSFDPSPRNVILNGLSTDASVQNTIGTGSGPTWCDAKTDEIQILTVTGCVLGAASPVNIGFIGPKDNIYRTANFACDASLASIQTAIGAAVGSCPLVITQTGAATATGSSFKITIGYFCLPLSNWVQPFLLASSPLTLTISTLQEGGYKNAHYSGTKTTIPEIQSIFVDNSATQTFTITASNGATTAAISSTGNATLISSSILSSINAIYPFALESVVNGSYGANYVRYDLTFNASTISQNPPQWTVTATGSLALMTTLQDYSNYPQFKDSSVVLGTDTKGAGKYYCYKRELNYVQSYYYAASLNPGVLADVIGRPYSIGYCDLGDASRANVPIANMINKAGTTVSPNVNSVTVAAIKVTTFTPRFSQNLADSSSSAAWPLSGFTFFCVRMTAHIGNCARRTAAMKYMYNFYYSDAASIVQKAKGFSALPGYYRDIVVDHMINNIRCNDTGTLALADYKPISYSLIGNVILSVTLQTYISAFNNIDPTMLWTQTLADDSLANWNTFIANPDNNIGVFTMFASRAQKLQYLAPVAATISTSSFATLAVVPIYHLDAFANAANGAALRVTPAIMAGIYMGAIKYWDDSLIVAANSEYSAILPHTRINVIVRSQPSDVTAVFSRFMALKSSAFATAYGITNLDQGVRLLNYTAVLNPAGANYTVRDGELFVDYATLFQDGSFGYWLQSGTPSSSLATFCPDAACATKIVPSNVASIQNCSNDATTAVTAAGSDVSAMISYDYMLSSDPYCYPIVATVDWSIYSTSNSCPNPAITGKRVEFTSWLYGNPYTALPLASIYAVGANAVDRANVFTRTCHIYCNGTMLGFNYCNYRWCTGDVDFIQQVSYCDVNTQERTVTYALTPGNTCLRNSMYEPKQPVMIPCDYIEANSVDGQALTGIAIAGFIVTIALVPIALFSPKAKKSHDYLYLLVFILGSAFLHLSIYLLSGVNTESNCQARPWCINVAATVMIAPLIMKLNKKVYKKSDPNKPWYRDYIGLAQSFLMVGLDMICLLVVTLTTSTGTEIVNTYYGGVQDFVPDQLCVVTNVQTYEIIMIGYKIAFLIYGVAKSVLGRNADSDQSEEEFLANIYEANVTALAYFICTLVIFSPLSASARGVAIFVVVLIACGVITAPKLHFSKKKAVGQARKK